MNLEKIKNRQRLSWEGMFYSIQRIDLLIVSFSAGGIYLCLELLKFINEEKLNQDLLLVKISGCLFLLSIIVNFISQKFGYLSNRMDYLMCEVEIDCEGKKLSKKEKKELQDYDVKSEKYSTWTNVLNYVSIGLMFSGLILVAIFICLTY